MKWLKQKYALIPRPLRTAIHIGLIPLAILICFIVIGKPMVSGTLALRLAEKANMVGPGRILGTVEHASFPSTSVIVAEDDKGYIFCRYYPKQPFERPLLTYREKQGDLTLLACPFFLPDEDHRVLPVLLFCNDPQADSAQIDVTITIPNEETELSYTYTLSADRTTEEYFQFYIDVRLRKWSTERRNALNVFIRVSTPWFGTLYSRDSYNIQATVKLFSNGKEYRTENLTIDSVADDAYERFGKP